MAGQSLPQAAGVPAKGCLKPADPHRQSSDRAASGSPHDIGFQVGLTQRDFDVVVGDRTIDPAIAERMTTNAFGHIKCLVNNAGLSAKSRGDLFDVSAESYATTIEVPPPSHSHADDRSGSVAF
jgi:NAD(P)-dependent dehydrogenase (short-subunit alcohol dehydrogenase family)